jgi:hypothetical protein
MLTLVGLGGAAIAMWRKRFFLPSNVLLFLGIAMIGVWGQTVVRGTHSLIYPLVFIPGARYTYPVIILTMLVLNTGWLEVAQFFERRLHLASSVKSYVYFFFFLGLDAAALFTVIHYFYIR